MDKPKEQDKSRKRFAKRRHLEAWLYKYAAGIAKTKLHKTLSKTAISNMIKKAAAIMVMTMLSHAQLTAQTTWFADGYHGGVYGHYPLWVTKFIADTLHQHPDWRVNLEIEPETWDTVAVKDPQGYAAFKQLWDVPTAQAKVEYVNPAYGQSYLYTIEGESIIRQFQYGMAKLRQHFTNIDFTTYSSEEPCFTTAVPQILTSLGFKYAVLKNPNTCWGGYTRAYGGEAVNWRGPDGSTILTVPRYTTEALEVNSTWQTTAWNNSSKYLNAAFAQGITKPIAMCLQDAGWKNGEWLGSKKPATTQYTRWSDYFGMLTPSAYPTWRVSQEDMLVSLVWGSQILQQIAEEVRAAENKIVAAEKIASLAKLYANAPYPAEAFDKAWRTLLLSQHHDCWIVPYNGSKGNTWADKVKVWTGNTINTSDSIIHSSTYALVKAYVKQQNIIAYNTTNAVKKEFITVDIPEGMIALGVADYNNKPLPTQVITVNGQPKQVLFQVNLQPLSYTTYRFANLTKQPVKGAAITQQPDGLFVMETDLYRLVIDAQHGGTIQHLIAKQYNNKDFVDATTTENFNGLRGNFYKQGGMQKSSITAANITITENGPYRIALQVHGTIANNSFTQTIQLTQGQHAIDCKLHIDYADNTRIGEDYMQDTGYKPTDLHKAFYNDTSKLILTFPLKLAAQKVYKDAPFDVTESYLSNTFFNRWDSIKNNVLLHWVDVTDGAGQYGLAILSNHTTNYAHGEHFPLSLTVQYAGVGLWGRNYSITGPTDISYTIIPHSGNWQQAGLNAASTNWNEPILTRFTSAAPAQGNMFIQSNNPNIQVTAMQYQGNDLLVRLYNAGNNSSVQNIQFNCYAAKAQLVELNGRIIKTFAVPKGSKVTVPITIPMFGVRTIKLVAASGLER